MKSLYYKFMNSSEVELLSRNGITPIDVMAKGNYCNIISCAVPSRGVNLALKRIPELVFKVNEVDFLMNLDSSRINKLYNYYTYDGTVYLLFEQCPFNILNYIKARRSLTALDKVRLVQEMILALRACHERNVAHSNIKPTNFLVDNVGHIKLTDYGISYIWKENPSNPDYPGSRNFLAPEQFGDEHYDRMKSDVWALGVSLFFIATGRLPFASKDQGILIKSIQSGIFMEGMVEDSGLRDVIKSCLNIHPDERPTCDDLLEMSYFEVIKNTPQQIHQLKRRASLKRSREIVILNSTRRGSMDLKEGNLGLRYSHETFQTQKFFELHKTSY